MKKTKNILIIKLVIVIVLISIETAHSGFDFKKSSIMPAQNQLGWYCSSVSKSWVMLDYDKDDVVGYINGRPITINDSGFCLIKMLRCSTHDFHVIDPNKQSKKFRKCLYEISNSR